MKIIRIFVKEDLSIDATISLANQHYIINVMKRKLGDNIILINGKAGEFLSEIIEIKKQFIKVKIITKLKDFYQEKFLGLIFSPTQKIDLLLKNATELGITNFLPFKAEFCQHFYKFEKYETNIIEAIEQCERTDLPIINKEDKLKNILDNLNTDDNVIIFCEERSRNLISNVILNEFICKNIYVLIGCEGGFSESEKDLIKSYSNVISISLGHRILRTENAISAILGIINYLIC